MRYDLFLIACAVALKFWTPAPAWVETRYSNGVYPVIDAFLRKLIEPWPVAIGDLLAIVAAIGLGIWWYRSWRIGGRAPGTRLLRAALRTGGFLAAIYIWFVTAWGLNYQRIPLSQKIPLHREKVDTAAVSALADHAATMLDANVAGAHAARHSDEEQASILLPTFRAATERLGDRARFEPPLVKPTIFDALMKASATYGFTDPWTHEVNLVSTIFPFERPAAYAHEWSHVAGFADETEANYIAVLTCIRSADPLARYSGWMLVWFNLPQNVHVTHAISPAVRADIDALITRNRRDVKPVVAGAQRAAYDTYLKANKVEAGFDSYRLFVRWMTGADYDAEGLPVVAATLP